jgi:hypothetical protein
LEARFEHARLSRRGERQPNDVFVPTAITGVPQPAKPFGEVLNLLNIANLVGYGGNIANPI